MIVTVPDSWGTDLREFNQCHNPKGADGGKFCSTPGTAAAPAEKVQSGKERPQPNDEVAQEAAAYNAARGRPPVDHTYGPHDQAQAGRIADAYDALPVFDDSPEVAEAYTALATEVRRQWDHAVDNGMRFIPWTKEGQPYQTSAEMAEDVRQNRRLYFYTGGDPNPFMAQIDERTGLSVNDMFRAIHDYYGHTAGGFGFGPRGEENAWRAHSQMFSGPAQRALTTETRGQNSWVNFGRHNYDAQGNYRNIPPAKRPFATQKTALLPAEYLWRAVREAVKPPPIVRKPAPERPEDEVPYPPPPPKPKRPLREGNDCHLPAGAPDSAGGQFCSKTGKMEPAARTALVKDIHKALADAGIKATFRPGTTFNDGKADIQLENRLYVSLTTPRFEGEDTRPLKIRIGGSHVYPHMRAVSIMVPWKDGRFALPMKRIIDTVKRRTGHEEIKPPGGGGEPEKAEGSDAYKAYLAWWPNYQPELDAFIAKHPRQAQMDLETVLSQPRLLRDKVPSYEFQTEVERAAQQRLSRERRAAKSATRSANKPAILAQLKSRYDMAVGDIVYDRESGTRGEVKWGRDGQPYVQTAMGKHLVGSRWQKAKT